MGVREGVEVRGGCDEDGGEVVGQEAKSEDGEGEAMCMEPAVSG